MKTICLIGGKLQGFEVAYLARKSGIQVHLIDRKNQPLIRNSVDEHFCFDITERPERLIELSRHSDAIIPTNENLDTLLFLKKIESELYCPLLFDFAAFHTSMDKRLSREYFKSIDIPIPSEKPKNPPYFVKPPCMSSSKGARIIDNDSEMANIDDSMVIEEYVPGPVVSLEVVGDGRNFMIGHQTQVHIDREHDCHRVTPMETDANFREIAYLLASNLCLKGIMDVEAILSPEGIRVIEIDARFPSQTPTVVYHSVGVNLLEWLMGTFAGKIKENNPLSVGKQCNYEHLMVSDGKLIPVGEHMLSGGDDYRLFHESNGLEIFKCKGKRPIYTLISSGTTRHEMCDKRKKAIQLIKSDMKQ
ncbi:3-methylornithine--L-lysine ligase PylC [Methanohalophilus profundi]|uniref:3-methylornithine--L-lysine ligase PylC n=1 Tax=Methanohalophilus profundi TaxID=2138083 RepID=UPI00101D397A|nr:3-methylornithine--L-lysine ligase PylC [Methanohalophilus profundi]